MPPSKEKKSKKSENKRPIGSNANTPSESKKPKSQLDKPNSGPPTRNSGELSIRTGKSSSGDTPHKQEGHQGSHGRHSSNEPTPSSSKGKGKATDAGSGPNSHRTGASSTKHGDKSASDKPGPHPASPNYDIQWPAIAFNLEPDKRTISGTLAEYYNLGIPENEIPRYPSIFFNLDQQIYIWQFLKSEDNPDGTTKLSAKELVHWLNMRFPDHRNYKENWTLTSQLLCCEIFNNAEFYRRDTNGSWKVSHRMQAYQDYMARGDSYSLPRFRDAK